MTAQKYTRQRLLIAIGVTVILALLIWFALSGDNADLLKTLFTENLSNEELSCLLMGFGWRGYIVVALLAALQVVCTFLPAEPVQVLAGFTFGFPIGLLCCMVGALVGSTLIFLLQKTFGEKLRGYFVKKLNLDFDKIARSSKMVVIIFILYFLPAIPYGMICFFAASLGMSYRRYTTLMCLGALPSVCIGVGLGYMTIMSSWVVTVCVFAVLMVLMGIAFWKKDVLFSRLNKYADDNKQPPKNKVREANGFVLNVLYYAARVYLFLCGVKIKATNKIGEIEGPSIVLCNHGSYIDFIYTMVILRKKKPNFVGARLYFYNKYLNRLLRTVGAFPKSMFAVDMENARNCFTVLRNKGYLVLMPEARLSTAGKFEDIQENTYSFIKTSGANIYSLKFGGDYFADPKWGKGFRRGSLVEAELDRLWTAEQLKELTLDQVKQGVSQRLYYDEFQWLEQHPKVRYRCAKMAEGLENILITCPKCGGKHTITTNKKKVFCETCGYLTSVDCRYRFTGDFHFKNLCEWYEWQKAQLEKEIAADPDYALSEPVELRLPGTGKGLTRHGGEGVCTLNREGLVYRGTRDGEQVEKQFSIERIYRLLFGAGQNFEVYDGQEIQYYVPRDPRTCVDWYMTSMILYDEVEKQKA